MNPFFSLLKPPPSRYTNLMFARKLRLFPRILILLLLITVVPVGLVGRIVVGINNESLQFEVQRYHLKLAQSLAEKFDERLTSIVSQLSLALDTIKNPTTSWEDKQKLLSALIDSSPNFGIIAAVASNGEEVIKAYNPSSPPKLIRTRACVAFIAASFSSV